METDLNGEQEEKEQEQEKKRKMRAEEGRYDMSRKS